MAVNMDSSNVGAWLLKHRQILLCGVAVYANPAYDELLDRAAQRDGSQRLELLRQAELLLLRDTPAIPLYTYVSRHLVDPRVRGFVDNARDVHLSRHLDLGDK